MSSVMTAVTDFFTTTDPLFLWLSGAALGLLVVATLIGAVLAYRVRTPAGRDTVRNLNARIRSWWVMVALFAAAMLLGSVVTLVLFAIMSYLALREFITLTPTRRGDHAGLFLSFFVVVPLQYWLVGTGWYGLFSIFIPVYVFMALPSLSVLGADTTDFLTRTAKAQWGVMLAVYCTSHAPALLWLDIPGYSLPSALLLLYLMTVAQLSDVFQYVFGKLWGKTRLSPGISPSKTVEGLVGGGLTAVAIGTGLHVITPFSPLQAAGMSLVIVTAGFFGGFVLSAMKRDLGVKDWGTMIEGHGGVLDRLDSVVFSAPLFFHLTRYWFT
ncbi:Phosphatidate cytidylyltransferase (EC 2.7.7.41) [Azospirillum endophyticum]